MGISRIMRMKWSLLKRSKVFYILIIFNYLLLSMIDSKSIVMMSTIEDYIFRFIYQQVWIIITSALFVNIIFDEKNIQSIKSFMIIYIKDIKNEIYGTALLAILINIIALLIGHIMLLTSNYLYYGEIFLSVSIHNFIITSLEIITSVLFVMSLRIYFKKNIIVFGFFYLTLISMLAINNVFITMPLTIKIVGVGAEGYYVTYGWQLWAGRIFLLFIAYSAFNISISNMRRELNNV